MGNSLTESKEYIAVCKKHEGCFIFSIFAMILFGVMLYKDILKEATPILWILEVISLYATIIGIIAYKTTYIACTSIILSGHAGVIFSKRLLTPLAKVQSIGISNGPLGKIFGYHTVKIHNAGTGKTEYVFTMMNCAEKFVDKVNEFIVELNNASYNNYLNIEDTDNVESKTVPQNDESETVSKDEEQAIRLKLQSELESMISEPATPLTAYEIINMLKLEDKYHTDLRILLKYAKNMGLLICDDNDIMSLCRYLLENKNIRDEYCVSEVAIREILRKAIICDCNNSVNTKNTDKVINPLKTISLGDKGDYFEEYCADIIRNYGYEHVVVTKKSGDHGADILADRDDVSFAIQCKNYSNPVGNSAVQEAYSAKKFYDKDIAVVMTNSTFTKQAIEEAERLHVKLWDGRKIQLMESLD